MTCVFCEIIAGTAKAEIVYDGYTAIGVVPLKPVTEGHLIFIPRKHVKDALEDPNVTGEVMRAAANYAKNFPITEGCNIITSRGPAATQTVFHLHIHLVPRRLNDGLQLPWTNQMKADQ